MIRQKQSQWLVTHSTRKPMYGIIPTITLYTPIDGGRINWLWHEIEWVKK